MARGKTAGGRRFQCTLSVVAESRPQNPWVGLLAWKERIGHFADSRAASPSPADGPSGYSKRRAFTYSGGTAPDFHRTSLLCPSWAPKASGDTSTPRHAVPNLLVEEPTRSLAAADLQHGRKARSIKPDHFQSQHGTGAARRCVPVSNSAPTGGARFVTRSQRSGVAVNEE